MDCYELNIKQFIPEPIEEVFSFFSKPENLKKITPKQLYFTINTPSPIPMKLGQIIDYTIKIKGIPVRWRSLISSYDPPHSFIDEQVKGPYSLWHHTHRFKEENGGTVIFDYVKYKIPFGLVGRIANFIWISKDLKRIFNYRKKIIAEIFKCQLN